MGTLVNVQQPGAQRAGCYPGKSGQTQADNQKKTGQSGPEGHSQQTEVTMSGDGTCRQKDEVGVASRGNQPEIRVHRTPDEYYKRSQPQLENKFNETPHEVATDDYPYYTIQ